MPPKKRGRKATPKSKSKSAAADHSSPPPSPPSVAARSETPSSPITADPLPTSEIETPVTNARSNANPASVTPETPAVNAGSDSNPISVSETPDSDSNPVSVTETPAANTDSVSNPVSVSETPAVNVDSDSVSNIVEEAPPATGTKKKVVKVVKKIVKKKVLKPKAPTSSQAEKVEEPVEAVSETVTVSENSVSVAQSEALNTVAETAKTEPMEEEKEENLPVSMETSDFEGKKDMAETGDAEVKKDEDNDAEEKKEASVEEGEGEGKEVVGDEEGQISERQKRRRTEIFVGGLDRDAKEEDLRNVFGKVGEIVEVRMMMDGQTGKNKGYAFVRYREASQAKQAVAEFSKVEICGKVCGAAALEGNDTIFLGNIDKKWKKEDLVKVLQDIGIEKIDTVTVMVDPHNTETNRGFAFLELESNRDAQAAFKKLSKNDAFGEGLNIKVAWAEPLNDPDEDEMQKVKSVYVECVPSSWDEATLRESFTKFGEIERIVLSRNMPSAKRKDFAFVNYTTRDAALSCIESFNKEEIPDDSLKVKLKVSLAKPTRKEKQNKGMLKLSNTGKVKTKPIQVETKFRTAANNGSSSRGGPNYGAGDRKLSMSSEFLHPRAAWQQGQVGYGRGPAFPDYSHGVVGGKRNYSAMGQGEVAPSYPDWRGFPRARFDSSYPAANSSYGAVPVPQVPPGPSMPYYQRPDAGYGTGSHPYGAGRPYTFQRQGFPHPPFGSNMYPRY